MGVKYFPKRPPITRVKIRIAVLVVNICGLFPFLLLS